MTQEDVKHYTQEIKDAVQSGDEARIRCAHARILVSMMDCQAKTADRVKEMYKSVGDILRDYPDILKSHKQYQNEQAEKRGAKKMLAFVKYILIIGGSSGAGAAILELLKTTN